MPLLFVAEPTWLETGFRPRQQVACSRQLLVGLERRAFRRAFRNFSVSVVCARLWAQLVWVKKSFWVQRSLKNKSTRTAPIALPLNCGKELCSPGWCGGFGFKCENLYNPACGACGGAAAQTVLVIRERHSPLSHDTLWPGRPLAGRRHLHGRIVDHPHSGHAQDAAELIPGS